MPVDLLADPGQQFDGETLADHGLLFEGFRSRHTESLRIVPQDPVAETFLLRATAVARDQDTYGKEKSWLRST